VNYVDWEYMNYEGFIRREV